MSAADTRWYVSSLALRHADISLCDDFRQLLPFSLRFTDTFRHNAEPRRAGTAS